MPKIKNASEGITILPGNFPEQFIGSKSAIQILKGISLTDRELRVLAMRECKQTLKNIGNKLGVSSERIRQIEAKALRKLRYPWKKEVIHV